MRNSTYLKMGLNMLVHSKLRSWLTIIGIVIGIGSVVGILSLGEAMEEQVQSKLAEMDLTLITISPGYTKASSNMHGPGGWGGGGTTTDVELTDDDIDALQGLDGVEYIAGQISGSEPVVYAAQNATMTITGVDTQVWQYMTTLETQSGRLLEPSDKYVAVIGSSVATETYDQEIGINQVITINGKSVRVVGILTEEGQGDRSIYMPIDSAVNLIDDAEDDVYDTITVKAKSEDLVDGLMEDIEEKLMISRHIIQEDDRDFTVSASKSMAESVTEMTSSMTLFLGAIAAVSLLVGAVGIANTMFTSVLEKTKEIGTMKAIGAKNRDILMIFLFNSAMVGLVGGILGVTLGAFVSSGLQAMMGQMTSGRGVSLHLMIEGLVLAIVIGVISGVVPAYRASKLKPVDALRYE
jgi:putative ABC transport system permease protein